ncbi:hypothetical protein E8E01_01650 [Methylorubrum populi]|uniref:ComEC/Rec2 family competence protein n=1 Tax=Methylorubrum populi TaxID=223967 RepID=UPI00114E6096|nr:hypothetical protein [Methylorubrum populi]QDI79220.1 hypothetical protein E8E01_01650 [Methylorubrum populi]
MLKIHILNVGQGSSIVLERISSDVRHYGVIDCNRSSNQPNKLLDKLQEIGAYHLSFVALTHPHKDHYSGLFDIITRYKARIDEFYTCPFGDLIINKERFKKYASHLAALARSAGLPTQRQAARELVQILAWADSSGVDWTECAGDENAIAPIGFQDVVIHTLTPAKISKGKYVERIDSGDPWMYGAIDDNDISLSFRINYQDRVVLLAGDASKSAWDLRARYEAKSGRAIGSQAANLPHHGSHRDCPPAVLTRLYGSQDDRYGITSAGGLTHPSIETIIWMKENNIDPYCTNLIAECGANVQKVYTLSGLDKEFARNLREAAKNTGIQQVCQGNVTITIDDGNLSVTPEHNNFCPFRKNATGLFS